MTYGTYTVHYVRKTQACSFSVELIIVVSFDSRSDFIPYLNSRNIDDDEDNNNDNDNDNDNDSDNDNNNHHDNDNDNGRQ